MGPRLSQRRLGRPLSPRAQGGEGVVPQVEIAKALFHPAGPPPGRFFEGEEPAPDRAAQLVAAEGRGFGGADSPEAGGEGFAPQTGWGKMLILSYSFFVLLSVSLYLGIGIGVKWHKFGMRGAEAVPNIDLWRQVPGLVKDGVIFAARCGVKHAFWPELGDFSLLRN